MRLGLVNDEEKIAIDEETIQIIERFLILKEDECLQTIEELKMKNEALKNSKAQVMQLMDNFKTKMKDLDVREDALRHKDIDITEKTNVLNLKENELKEVEHELMEANYT